MKINIEITNQYGYDIAVYPYNLGALPSNDKAQIINRQEGRGDVDVEQSESAIVDIPGMGSLLIQFMGEQKFSEYHDKFCEQSDEFDQCGQMVLIRYKTSELYWRFPTSDDVGSVELIVNQVGTVCIGKVSKGSVRQISLQELFIPPVFLVNPTETMQEESEQEQPE
ncbi:hypothetical protein NI389_12515 [Pseudoalteromonas xiamenensis]|uniref:hypothetical protein n=1 Tax=Pseudoalteromonas xiamenensis TaxID=882626 RepID=UPI0027E5B98B|nr:hypothetical protein [Pseudoalteromonas xiamenensis]WMN59036.1 hypothetical protein NI389_12515 [Pseudoalteromonas xiamenensis]